MLEIKGLSVSIDGKVKLKDINLKVGPGELHVLMGPNGSGKSTLAFSIMGSPRYEIIGGKILLDGEDITDLPMEERARRGLFLSYQNPPEIPMVTYRTFLLNALRIWGKEPEPERIAGIFRKLNLGDEFLTREVNKGFSGGERKRAEMAQMLLFNPKYAILDEPDTGVDVDSLKLIASTISDVLHRDIGVLLITHYARILSLLPSHFTVHVLVDGMIRAEGGPELAQRIEERGFEGGRF